MNKYFCPITSHKEYQMFKDLGFNIQYVGIVLKIGIFNLNHLVIVYLDEGDGDPSEWEELLGVLAGEEYIDGFFEMCLE